MNNNYKLYDLTMGLFVAVLIISNIVSTKIIAVGPFTFDGGTILFPIVYIFGDVITEVYGFKGSRRIIWVGFFSLLLMSAITWIVGIMPAASGWNLQESYNNIFMTAPRIAIASMIAYWMGEFTNSFILAKMKVWTQGRHLWTRTVGSTIFGELIDTAVFCTIAFAGVLTNSLLVTVMVSNYIFKVCYEIIATPLTYWVVNIYKKTEKIDVYDLNGFNPFKINMTQ
ncbi:MAG: queuosine precursor transporter [Deltaproteobacteria bacterium]